MYFPQLSSFLIVVLLLSAPLTLLAQGRVAPVSLGGTDDVATSQSDDALSFRVRAIKATEAIPSWERLNKDSVDSRVKDLYPKFISMPRVFENYSLVCERSGKLSHSRKRVLKLSNGHLITLRSLHEGPETVVRVKWEDEFGKGLLDTRMRYDSSRNIQDPLVVGLERGPGEGLILAIDLQR